MESLTVQLSCKCDFYNKFYIQKFLSFVLEIISELCMVKRFSSAVVTIELRHNDELLFIKVGIETVA